MPVNEAIILAGGLGTRLRDAVPDLPKCMAPVNGIPFIAYVVKHLQQQGINRFIFSLGYQSDAFTNYLSTLLTPCSYTSVVEPEPLGTGGAIRFAAAQVSGKQAVVVNGDSIFKISLAQQLAVHEMQDADCTLALKPMQRFDRYGTVALHANGAVASFSEKKYNEQGLINGGVYILNIPSLLREALPEKYSFETDYLQQMYTSRKIFGVVQDAYFIDIGIPEDYQRAQHELKDAYV